MGYGMKHRGHILRRFLSHRIWSVGLIVLSVILLFLGHGNNDRLKDTRLVISSVTSPILEILSKPFSLANEAVDDVGKLVSLKEEVDRLKGENEKLRHLQAVALQKDIKLKQLQNFLNLKVDPRIKYLTGRAIANVNSPYKESVRLNLGRVNGVAKGQAVIDQNGFLGQVIQVDETSSVVLLISDINSRIPVRLEPGGVSAMLVGAQNNRVELKYLPYRYELKASTQIYTSGHGALLPAGILIGQVAQKGLRLGVTLSSDLKHVNYVKVLELKEGQGGKVTHAVMKLAPLPLKQKSLRESFAKERGPATPKSQAKRVLAASSDLSSLKIGTQSQGNESLPHQTTVLLNLEKRPSFARKTPQQRYHKPKYVRWRYHQSSRNRRWQARVFSGGVN